MSCFHLRSSLIISDDGQMFNYFVSFSHFIITKHSIMNYSTTSSVKSKTEKSTTISFESLEAYEEAWKRKARQVFDSFIDNLMIEHDHQLKSLRLSNRELNRRLDHSQKTIQDLTKQVSRLQRQNILLIQRPHQLSLGLSELIPPNFVPQQFSQISVKVQSQQQKIILNLNRQIIKLQRQIRDLQEVNINNNRPLEEMSVTKYLTVLAKKAEEEKKLSKMWPGERSTSFSCLVEKKDKMYQQYYRISMQRVQEIIMNPAEVRHVILTNQSKF